LESLANLLGNRFWADLEAHHPGICSLRLPTEIARGWKQRLQTTTRKVRTQTGQSTEITVPRLSYRECLTPVRAFYLDLAHWAVEDPGHWAAWVAPCPIGEEEGALRKVTRQRKARMDARTRERLPALPVLLTALDRHRNDTNALLEAARHEQPGDAFVVAGSVFIRRARADGVWADDATGKRRNLSLEQERAFWVWAIVEVLHATGVRVEELLELSHHSLVQYRLPTTGELIPLLQIARRRPIRNVSLWSAQSWPTYSPRSSTESEAHLAPSRSSAPTTTTNGCGCHRHPACSSAASTAKTRCSPTAAS
jgi:hypothetical protein